MRIRHLAVSLLWATPLLAQQPDFRWEKALPAGSTISLHNLNGDVTVTPSTTGKVEIVGARRGGSRYADDVTIEIVETSRGVTACSMFRSADMECDERGLRVHSSRNSRSRRGYDDASIDMQVKLPKGMELVARSVSGDVSVVGAEGDVRAGSVSGDVRMSRLHARSIRATSVSGNVTVGVEALTGNGPLTFTSVSGNVTAELPQGFDADVTMRSVSGSFDSDFPLTLSGGRMNRRSLEARIGKGGRDLEVRTVSGNVRLRAAK